MEQYDYRENVANDAYNHIKDNNFLRTGQRS